MRWFIFFENLTLVFINETMISEIAKGDALKSLSRINPESKAHRDPVNTPQLCCVK
jgi:hypothetical protein